MAGTRTTTARTTTPRAPSRVSPSRTEASGVSMSPAPGSDADVVRTYLEMLAVHRPRRGRKRTAESILRRMAVIDAKIPTVPPLAALHLAQERMDLEAELTALEHQKSAAAAERGFLQVAKRYAEQNGISYGAWRQAGVPVDVLRQAAISRPTR